jgi:hypothetical protein
MKDPDKRPSMDFVLSLPLLTGESSPRLRGEEPAYDIFISYRVASDFANAEKLYNVLTDAGYRVW